jgi:uncharacterized protein YbbK (DUF523 family)/uncharacterized protein YbgA (DUF1722 family)
VVRADTAPETGTRPIRIGISACLLGQETRFDGGHKRDPFLAARLGRFVEWVPVCPEVECGFGTPREPMRLERRGPDLRLVTVNSGVDLTAPMERFARSRVPSLGAEGLSGFVLKMNSPSCGLEHVKVYPPAGPPARSGRGLFAAALVEAYPRLPVEEEGRLADPVLREHFVERVFAYGRLRGLFTAGWTAGDLIRFHTAHKLQLLAHAPEAYRQLGRIVAGASGASADDVEERYVEGFTQALARPATIPQHTNALQHMAGYFKNRLDPASRRELADSAAASFHAPHPSGCSVGTRACST